MEEEFVQKGKRNKRSSPGIRRCSDCRVELVKGVNWYGSSSYCTTHHNARKVASARRNKKATNERNGHWLAVHPEVNRQNQQKHRNKVAAIKKKKEDARTKRQARAAATKETP